MNNLHDFLAQAGNQAKPDPGTLLFECVMILAVFVFAVLVFRFFLIWLRALAAGVKITFIELIALRLRRVPVNMIVDSFIVAKKAGIEVTIDDLSTHCLAGGNVPMVVQALVAIREAAMTLDFNRACAIDLAAKGTGKSIQQAVVSALTPRGIECPDPASGLDAIDAVTADGVRLKARALLTVRTNLARFIGGASEKTILSRVSEAISHAIRSCLNAREAIEDPDRISNAILRLELDNNAAFEILSLKINVTRH